MSDILEKNALYNDHMIRQRHLVAKVKILGNATPASKTHISDISDSIILRSEGLISIADGIEDLSASFTAANDINGIFGILIQVENCQKILKAQVLNEAGTDELNSSFISSSKNIGLDMDSAINLSTTDQEFTIVLDYLIK